MRRGYYRNYYKGHMEKIKVEGGCGGRRWVQLGWVEGWGEKSYNCNRITIKIFKNREQKYIFNSIINKIQY